MKKNQKGFSAVEAMLVVIVVGVIGFVGWYIWQQLSKKSTKIINSFETCAAAGNPIMATYPEQCSANGKTYTNSKQSKDPNLVYITLISKTHGVPLTLRKVDYYSDNGVRCFTTPCPTDSTYGSVGSDQNGVITLHKQDIHIYTTILPQVFRGERLNYNASKSSYTLEFEQEQD